MPGSWRALPLAAAHTEPAVPAARTGPAAVHAEPAAHWWGQLLGWGYQASAAVAGKGNNGHERSVKRAKLPQNLAPGK